MRGRRHHRNSLAVFLHDRHPETLIRRSPRKRPRKQSFLVGDTWMSTKPGQPITPSFRPRKNTERETQEVVVADAGNTGLDDRDLVHGEGGTLGLGEDEDLNGND